MRAEPNAPAHLNLIADIRLTRPGRAMRPIDCNGRMATGAAPNRSLLRLISQARAYRAELCKGESNFTELAKAEGVLDSYITRLLRLAFRARDCRGDYDGGTAGKLVIDQVYDRI